MVNKSCITLFRNRCKINEIKTLNTMITPILWYMSEVWGYESSVLDIFQLQYCTQILGLKQSTLY